MSELRLPPPAPPAPAFEPPGSTSDQPVVPAAPHGMPYAPPTTPIPQPPLQPGIGPGPAPATGGPSGKPPAKGNGSKVVLIVLAVLAGAGFLALVAFSIASYIETERTQRAERAFPTVVDEPNDRTVTYRESSIDTPGGDRYEGRFTVDVVDEYIDHESIDNGIDWMGDGSHWFTSDGDGGWTRFHNTPVDDEIDDAILMTARMRTIDQILPAPVRPFVAVQRVDDTKVGDHDVKRFDLLIDTPMMQRESRSATDAFVAVWGQETVDQDVDAIRLSVWVDADGMLWRFTSKSDFDDTFWTVIYEDVSEDPFEPDFPATFTDGN